MNSIVRSRYFFVPIMLRKTLAGAAVVAVALLAASPVKAQSGAVPLAANGKAKAVIVLGEGAGEGAKFAASQLQKYLHMLTGADFETASDGQKTAGAARDTWILIGGPAQNRLVKRALGKSASGFDGLKPDGFVLETLRIGKHAAIVAGGNDDAGDMYAVFELLNRLGVTFLLTGDIVPAQQSSLQIPALSVRMEPALARRGFLMELSHHPATTILGYDDYVRMIDQMAKMKDNYLNLWWFPYSPFLKFSYHGESKELGDASTIESSYLNSRYTTGGSQTTDDVTIGKHWFPGRRLVPPEMQNVQTPDEAFAAAQGLMQKVIHYAKSRHVQVWLVDEMALLPTNLGRHGERIGDLPFEHVFGSTFMHPLDPANRDMQVAHLKALVDTYPEAAGYLLNFSELYSPVDNARHHDFIARQEPAFAEFDRLRPPFGDWQNIGDKAMDDDDIADFDLFKFLLSKRNEIAPGATFGLTTLKRGYVLPVFDKLLPKDIPFTTFDIVKNTLGGFPMNYFQGLAPRPTTLVTYIDDDDDMLGMQFNVEIYTRNDHLFTDGVKYGLSGVAAWMAQPRGTEQNSLFLAEAAWNPDLTLEGFYKSYSERLFGAAAAADMYRAFLTLEENPRNLPATEFKRILSLPTPMSCCGTLRELNVAYEYSLQGDPYNGPTGPGWKRFIRRTPNDIREYEGLIQMEEKALASMRAAQAKVDPRGERELDYMICRTEAHRDDMRASITERRAFLEFDQAFRKRQDISEEQFTTDLEASLGLFHQALQQAQEATRKYAEIIDYPSDLEALYRLNTGTVMGYDLTFQWMQTIVNFWEGKPYAKHVPFERIFPGPVHTAHFVWPRKTP